MDPGEDRGSPRRDTHGAASHHRFGILTRDGLLTKVKEFGPGLNCRPKTEIPLHEAGEGRKGDNSVGREVMRLEAEETEELAEKVGRRETESPFEKGQEDDPFAGFRGRDGFCAGSATDNLWSDPAHPGQPVDVRLANIGSFPASRG